MQQPFQFITFISLENFTIAFSFTFHIIKKVALYQRWKIPEKNSPYPEEHLVSWKIKTSFPLQITYSNP